MEALVFVSLALKVQRQHWNSTWHFYWSHNLKPNKKAKKMITRTILAVLHCISCKSKIPDALGTTTGKCPSCNLKIKKYELLPWTTANIMIKYQNSENMGRFFCTHSVTNTYFLQSHEHQDLTLTKTFIIYRLI